MDASMEPKVREFRELIDHNPNGVERTGQWKAFDEVHGDDFKGHGGT